MNRVVSGDAAGTVESVACDTLEAIFDANDVGTADFVKIDIEGSEPALAASVGALRARVRSYYIEFSQFAPLAGYLALAQALLDAGYVCFDEDGAAPLRGVSAVEHAARAAFAAGPLAVTNLWFFARGR
jgi:hypothetical protein